MTDHPLDDLERTLRAKQPALAFGGRWSPEPKCRARHKVAIVVPHRNRTANLRLFVQHMHPFLSKQQLDYGIYLIEPVENVQFNRGLLMNIGFVESLKDRADWQCHTFHDVDLLPEDERNLYTYEFNFLSFL